MKRTVLIIAVTLLAISTVFVSCQSGNDGYKSNNGLVYKYHKNGNDTVTPKLGDYITVDMVYGSMKDGVQDSMMFDSKELPQVMKMPITEPTYKGDVYDAISMMRVGDSMTFIMNTDSVFMKLFKMNMMPPELDSIENLYFSLQLNNIETLEEVKAAQDIEMKRLEGDESNLRNDYLANNYPDALPIASGLYYIDIKEGKGNTPIVGDKVKVHYKGMFLDGTVFDSSIDRDEPIEFPLGQGQVIKGWDEGIGMMRKGGKAVLVIPSDIAYGPNGRGSIPPFSTLVFEVELVDITK
jgi:FKBP-type peptidyl-prolyl cis-trans isomerase